MLLSFCALFSTSNEVPKKFVIMDTDMDFRNQAAYDIPDFWNLTEIQQIPLNISIESEQIEWNSQYQKNYTVQKLFYTSQIWNNTPLRCYAALIIPDNTTGQLETVPGIVIIHGLGGSHSSMMDMGYFAAAYNYTVLAIDLPGHGQSGGPPPSQEWIIPDLSNYTGTITPDILNRTHFYLIARAAIRAVDVLLNQSFVDPTKIAMSGGSYGGLTTMFASNVYWQKVRSAIPVVASGNLAESFSTPYSLTNLVVDPNQYDITLPPYSDLINYFDPIYYVNSTHNPSTLFICGTNDDFFPLETFNDTFYATNNATKGMCMSPGGHHGILMQPWEGTILYWLNYTIEDGPAPPNIQLLSRSVETSFTGKKLKITVNVSCEASISKVIFAYHREIMGAPWQTREMTQINSSTWNIELRSLPFNADVTYFIMVELDGELYTMFSSSAWRDSLTTWLQIPFFILIAFGLAVPIFFLVKRDTRILKTQIPKENHQKLHKFYIYQLAIIAATEVGIALSLILPIAIILPQTSHMEFSVTLLLTEFIDFLPIISLIGLVILVAGFILAMAKPVTGGIINLLIPGSLTVLGIIIIFQIGSLGEELAGFGVSGGLLGIGFGLILWLIMGAGQVTLGIYKRHYIKKLVNT
jgi:pimeloyl-ACP methyl ester carboxylesterase